ncbi:MAG: ATPase subunit of ABC transporter with duplicated ATPase domains, partial [Myxococcota bacterium]
MISFTKVAKQYGAQILFADANFQINPGEKVGLVGANGSGKSTIFRLIMGEDGYDGGTIEQPKRLTLGYFRQDVGEYEGRSVLEETKAGAGEVGAMEV